MAPTRAVPGLFQTNSDMMHFHIGKKDCHRNQRQKICAGVYMLGDCNKII